MSETEKLSESDLDLLKISGNVNITIPKIIEIIHNFREVFKHNINISNIIDSVVELMKLVGQNSKLCGYEKKYLVSTILIYIVKNETVGEKDTILETILINLIPVIIDKLISVENEEIVFNQEIKKQVVSCFSACTKK